MSDFTEAAKGRFPLQKDYGSAFSLDAPDGSPGKGVPRPDIPLWLLRTLSCFPLTGLLGIDHFYVRSPITGLLKFLLACCIIPCVILIVYPTPGESFIKAMGSFLIAILGCIFFSLWYIWDAVQVTAEGDRVVHYGMSVPFDLLQGIAQGMITDKKTHYEASSSILDILSRYFGWLFPAFSQYAAGYSNAGHRLAFISIVGIVFALMITFKWSGWEYATTFGAFHWILMILAGVHWCMMRAGYPESSYSGLHKTLNYFNLIKQYKNDEMDKAIEIKKIDFSGGKLYQPVRHKDYDKINPEITPDLNMANIPPFVAFPVLIYRAIKMGISIAMSMTPMGRAAAAAAATTQVVQSQVQAVQNQAQAVQNQAQAATAGAPILAPTVGLPLSIKAPPPSTKAPPPPSKRAKGLTPQTGGAREELSTESQILGATVFALIGGGIMKAVVDNLV
jgi:hypothetical protein